MTEKRIVTRLITVILLLVTVASVILPASAASDTSDDGFAETLRAAGFPDTYIPDLLALHKKHPEWTFEAINITALSHAAGNEVYTWDYVIKQESDANEKRNLVTKADDQFILRNFTNPNLYDSGWYQASKSAVEYMMDPRNFLTEEQVFQFFDLRYSETATLDAVKAVCAGTFMQDAGLDDIYADMTYAEYFMQIGKELGANPVYLATVVRNEQGVKGTSPLISGLCGDKLWYYYNGKYTDKDENGKLIKAPASGHSEDGLKAYNGLYNYFQHQRLRDGIFFDISRRYEGGCQGHAGYVRAVGRQPSMEHTLEGALRRCVVGDKKVHKRLAEYILFSEIQCRSAFVAQFLGAIYAKSARQHGARVAVFQIL